jgi:type IV secretory pathway VirD2 relaxase
MKWAGDRHHFRLIVSPRNGRDMDMVQHVRDLMAEAGKDQGTKLDWRAVIHRDTEHVHAQIVIRGKRDDGRTLYLDRAYISQGLRHRSQELATKELGLRHRDREMVQAERVMEQERRLKLREVTKAQSKGHDLTPSIGP